MPLHPRHGTPAGRPLTDRSGVVDPHALIQGLLVGPPHENISPVETVDEAKDLCAKRLEQEGFIVFGRH
jgi:hypothetical protein